MANCHDLFSSYYDQLRIKQAKRSSLRTSRDANRERIRAYFRDTLDKPVPKFKGQGSYPMHTGVNPLHGDYDVDDGVYLQGLGTDVSQWPKPETVHGWIVDAVKGYTSEPPKDKARCVRVRYASDYPYHVDLPIYALDGRGVALLFEKGKAPYESDPRAFSEWFCGKASRHPQIRRLVRYYKGWRDEQQGGTLVAKGITLTILVAENFRGSDRDDVALVETAKAICSHMEWNGTIRKPVSPYEDLAANWTETERTLFRAKLRQLRDRGQDALDEEDRAIASGIWRELFGDRFPKIEPEKAMRDALRTSWPAILGNDGRSA